MRDKIGVREIQLERYEGPVEDCGRSWAKDWGGAEVALRAWARTAPGGELNPHERGYDKVGFTVVWENGYEYHGRFDLTGSNAHELPMQVARELGLAAGAWWPSWMDARQYERVRAMYAREGDPAYRERCGALLDTLDLGEYGPVGGGRLSLGDVEGRVIDKRVPPAALETARAAARGELDDDDLGVYLRELDEPDDGLRF